MLERICTTCKVIKPVSEFHRNYSGKYGVTQKCKECTNLFQKQYRTKHHLRYYASKYNSTEEIVQNTLNKTVCAICGCAPKLHKRHSIDHCHISGKIRGLLCDECNTGLGKFKDNQILLKKAIDYLNDSK